MKIFIDPGHGGEDAGAKWWGYREKDINLNVSLFLWHALKTGGYEVMLSRTRDETVSLASRTRMANDWNSDAFVSIHCDAFDSQVPAGQTVHVYEHTTVSGELGHSIVNAFMKRFPDHRQRGLRRSDFFVLRETNMPAVLVECEFLSNPKMARWLASIQSQCELAETICEGINNYQQALVRQRIETKKEG